MISKFYLFPHLSQKTCEKIFAHLLKCNWLKRIFINKTWNWIGRDAFQEISWRFCLEKTRQSSFHFKVWILTSLCWIYRYLHLFWVKKCKFLKKLLTGVTPKPKLGFIRRPPFIALWHGMFVLKNSLITRIRFFSEDFYWDIKEFRNGG